jgi:uridine kinase
VTVVHDVAAVVATLVERGRVLVGVDGPDAAGKTRWADALAGALTVPVVRASVDGFHRPRRVRHRRGALSPEGYYRDSFDQEALERELLRPFATGARDVRTAVFDHTRDAPAVVECNGVPEVAALVVDGVFLLRPELRDWWTLSVYLHVPEAVTLARGRQRDVPLLGTPEVVEHRYRARYLPGQALYRAEADPHAGADVVLDNSNPAAPVVLAWRTPAIG